MYLVSLRASLPVSSFHVHLHCSRSSRALLLLCYSAKHQEFPLSYASPFIFFLPLSATGSACGTTACIRRPANGRPTTGLSTPTAQLLHLHACPRTQLRYAPAGPLRSVTCPLTPPSSSTSRCSLFLLSVRGLLLSVRCLAWSGGHGRVVPGPAASPPRAI